MKMDTWLIPKPALNAEHCRLEFLIPLLFPLFVDRGGYIDTVLCVTV